MSFIGFACTDVGMLGSLLTTVSAAVGGSGLMTLEALAVLYGEPDPRAFAEYLQAIDLQDSFRLADILDPNSDLNDFVRAVGDIEGALRCFSDLAKEY